MKLRHNGLRCDTFFTILQDRWIAGLNADINRVQSRRFELSKLIVALSSHVICSTIHCKFINAGKIALDETEQIQQITRLERQDIFACQIKPMAKIFELR